ncbi:FtsQ-type POTRA domain-containing protein [uncultured Desulfuromonas sp.]|uniref:cell division protein FtsQ/DivIB n=1 Tax=uncultured Desulfuromonas sp. TaxID=181013 RepID=UPI002AAA704A|nr:FtsQ-type POTRA domain-containing protein [uncultured Desulfuromonas sp.]
MRDMKPTKGKRARDNVRVRPAREWKKVFTRLLHGILILCCTVLIVSGATLLMNLVSNSDHFRVETIEVVGNRKLTDQDVIALSDIRQGVRTFDLDLEIIGQKLAENDWIHDAVVERKLPRGIVIRLRERETVFIINLDYLFYVDRSGEIFKVLRAGDPLNYPLVSGMDRQQLLDEPDKSREQLQQVATLIDQLDQRKVFDLQDVSQIKIDTNEGLILYTGLYGVPIKIGWKDYADKLDRLEKIYPELEPRLARLSYINLNVPDKVIVKKMTGQTIL